MEQAIPETGYVIAVIGNSNPHQIADRLGTESSRVLAPEDITAISHCDCILVDIRIDQQQMLSKLAARSYPVPILALATSEHDFNSGYPYGCPVFDVCAEHELGQSLFWHRVHQAVEYFRAPLKQRRSDEPMMQLLLTMVEHSSDWIFVKDLEHRFLLASEGFAEEAGFSIDQVIGKTDADLGNTEKDLFGDPETGWAGFWPQDDAVTSSGVMAIEDNPGWTLFSQSPRHRRTVRVPLKNHRGEVYSLLVCSQDVTEHKQNEQMLRERTDMLSRVTEEKQNAERNRRLAEEAVAAKNRFLAAASHDLRQPLHAMGLFLDVLESRMSSDENQEIMQRVKHSCASLNTLFNSLLDISRLDAGVVETDCENIYSEKLIMSLREEFRQLASAKGIAFVDSADGSVFYSDFVLLSRVVRNIVVNAIDNTESGFVSVTLQGSEQGVLLSVSDSGPGIPESEQTLIFDEFHQVPSHVAEKGKGIGLGLAIVKRLCELLEIKITLTSKEGSGTCFLLRIPQGKRSTAAPSVGHSVDTGSLTGVRILVVDDEEAIRIGMQEMLTSYGCDCLVAAEDSEVVSILGQEQWIPDLIIADYQLASGVTGDALIATVREHVARPVPALLVTGDTSPESKRKSVANRVRVIHKPVSPEQLIWSITALLDSHQIRN